MLMKRAVLLAKIEVTYNTDSVPVQGSDAVLVENLNLQFPPDISDRPLLDQSISSFAHLVGRVPVNLSFDVELKGSGTNDTPPDWGVLLLGCKFGETINASTDVTYDPVSDADDSLTMYVHRDGLRYIVTGARGNVSFNLTSGKRGMMTFNFTGHMLASPADIALPASPTYDATVPPAIVNSAFAVGGYSGIISALEFSMNNQVDLPDDLNSADGYGEVRVVSRDLQGSFDPETVLVATNAFVDDFRTGAANALTVTVGSAAGNTIDIDMPVVTYREANEGDRNGIVIYEMGFGASRSSGDDEIQIVHT